MFSSIFSAITSGLGGILASFRKYNPQALLRKSINKITNFVRKFIKMMTKKPSEKKDYLSIGKLFISKRMFFLLLVGFIVGLTLFVNFALPWMEGKLWTVNLYIGSEKYNDFSGKARLYDNAGVLIFEGKLDKGKATGYGTQYTTKGEMIYKGEFKDNAYSGQGEKYENTQLLYKGAFSNNVYSGEGEIYAPDGVILYRGNFENGERSGNGTEFDANTGNKIYTGAFKQDQRSGEGKEYLDNGKTLIYEGSFSANKYDGNGKKYTDEKLEYNGSFKDGLYSGEGALYDLDTGHLLYKGSFGEGKYNGEGTLYDVKNDVKLYVGSFENGKRSGEGTAFDILGTVKYSGTFKDDNIDYIAALGKKEEEILETFGKASYNAVEGNQKFITYASLGICMIFDIPATDSNDDTDNSGYILSRIIMTMKDTPYGIKPDSTPEQVYEKLGKKNFSALDFIVTDMYKTAFARIGLTSLGNYSTLPAVKYIVGDDSTQFIRLYYTPDKSKIEALELSSTS